MRAGDAIRTIDDRCLIDVSNCNDLFVDINLRQTSDILEMSEGPETSETLFFGKNAIRFWDEPQTIPKGMKALRRLTQYFQENKGPQTSWILFTEWETEILRQTSDMISKDLTFFFQGMSIEPIEPIEAIEIDRSQSKSIEVIGRINRRSIEVIVEAIEVNQSFKKM